jgi:hypothetical protein
LKLARSTGNIEVDFVALNKLALRHTPWFNEVKHAICSTARQQPEPCAMEQCMATVAVSQHSKAPCNWLPTVDMRPKHQSAAPSPLVQSPMLSQKRSDGMPPRAPQRLQRPQTAPPWSKSVTESPSARPWTAHAQRSSGASQESELCRARARPGSGGSPTSLYASMQTVSSAAHSMYPCQLV